MIKSDMSIQFLAEHSLCKVLAFIVVFFIQLNVANANSMVIFLKHLTKNTALSSLKESEIILLQKKAKKNV